MTAQRQRYRVDVHRDTGARQLYSEHKANKLGKSNGTLQRSCDKKAGRTFTPSCAALCQDRRVKYAII